MRLVVLSGGAACRRNQVYGGFHVRSAPIMLNHAVLSTSTTRGSGGVCTECAGMLCVEIRDELGLWGLEVEDVSKK